MKKKIAAVLLTLSMVVSIAGCGQEAQTGGTQSGGTQSGSSSDSTGAENLPSDGIPVPEGWDDPYEETLLSLIHISEPTRH